MTTNPTPLELAKRLLELNRNYGWTGKFSEDNMAAIAAALIDVTAERDALYGRLETTQSVLKRAYDQAAKAEHEALQMKAERDALRDALEWVQAHMRDQSPLPESVCAKVMAALKQTLPVRELPTAESENG